MPKNFNDTLCLFLMIGIFTMWILDGLGKLSLNPEVLGATLVFFTIIGQYYFRKKPSLTNPPNSK